MTGCDALKTPARGRGVRSGRLWLLIVLGAVALHTATVQAQPPVFVKLGSLLDPSSFGSGSAFKEVELGDLNGDGRLDLYLPQKQPDPIFPLVQGPNIDILYLSTNGELILALDPLENSYSLRPASVAFIDPPGLPALLTSRAYDAEIWDLDQDDALDIIRPDAFSRVDVWWGEKDPVTGQPTGRFDDRTDVLLAPNFDPNAGCDPDPNFFPFDGNYDDVDLADVDCDGDMDVVVAQRLSSSLCRSEFETRNFLVENLQDEDPGGRRFAIRTADEPVELPTNSTHAVSFGDVDPTAGCSALDVAVADVGTVRLYLGRDNVPFDFDQPPLELCEPFMTSPRDMAVADFVDLNGDGHVDVFVAENDVPSVTMPEVNHGIFFHSGDPQDPFPRSLPCDQPASPGDSFAPAPEIDFAALNLTEVYGLYDARYADLDGDQSSVQMEIVAVNQNVDDADNVRATVVQVLTVIPPRQIVDVTSTYMEPAADLEGGMGVALGDLDGDGDPDMVLAGAVLRDPPFVPGTDLFIVAAATVYENRTVTYLTQRTLNKVQGQPCTSIDPCTVTAIKDLTAGLGVTVPSGAHVTFEAGDQVVLSDGFTADLYSEFTATIF